MKLAARTYSIDSVHVKSRRHLSVIAGFDPAIHLPRKSALAREMDPRVKPAGDADEGAEAAPTFGGSIP
jgi:hypothetical protein